jgi:hypothetical protein
VQITTFAVLSFASFFMQEELTSFLNQAILTAGAGLDSSPSVISWLMKTPAVLSSCLQEELTSFLNEAILTAGAGLDSSPALIAWPNNTCCAVIYASSFCLQEELTLFLNERQSSQQVQA